MYVNMFVVGQLTELTTVDLGFLVFKLWELCKSAVVCSCHVTYAFQSESALYSYLNVKELLA